MDRILVSACLLAGATALLLGVVRYWPSVRGLTYVEAMIQLAPVLVAAPLAVFAMEHIVDAPDVSAGVPAWLPFHIAVTYAVGIALLAIAASFALRVGVKHAASVLISCFLSFVLLIHIPNILGHWKERLYWNLALRDLLFCSGTLVFASTLWPLGRRGIWAMSQLGRTCASVALIVFGLQHFLFPRFAPGVPLPKLTPSWMPLPVVLACLSGAVLLFSGACLFIKNVSRRAAALGGTLLCILTIVLYVPILVFEFGSPDTVEGINYVADTLLASGVVLMCGSRMTEQLAEEAISHRTPASEL